MDTVDLIEKQQSQENVGKMMMRAIVHTRFGPPSETLEMKKVPVPVPNELRGVLVKVYASSVNPADKYEINAPVFMRLIGRMGIRKPKDPVPGSDTAGIVVSVADKVTQFKPGDEVFGSCLGSYAEYAVARVNRLTLKPQNVSFEQAAAVPIAGITALQALRDHGQLKPGQKVLITGASGGVGSFAVQIAKAMGAEVVAVCSTRNVERVRSLGADRVIDYTKEDFTKTSDKYDLICDAASTHSISELKHVMNPSGICLFIGSQKKVLRRLVYFIIRGKLLSRGDKKFKFFVAKINDKDLGYIAELMATGKVRSLIDRHYPLEDTAEAVNHLAQGHVQGKIIITVNDK